MQLAALLAHVLVYLCFVAERAHKAQHSSEGFYAKQVAMLYSARKHKKQPAPGSCLVIKHIYTMMSMPVPKVCFRLLGQKSGLWHTR